MKIDLPALAYATLLETALAVLAALGGPHGYLGMLPWLLQLPGMLLLFFGPHVENKVWVIVPMFLIQVVVWYAVIATWRRVRRRKKESV